LNRDNGSMQEPCIPLFPLEAVLLPSNILPLHIFEDRYKQMIGEALAANTEFGVVQANEKGILNLGCTAAIEQVVTTYEDGRMDIVTVGRRRFEILFLDETKPYLQGAVNFFDDEDTTEPSHESKSMALACFELLRRQQDSDRETPSQNDPRLSFKIAELVPDLSLRQTLLAMRSEADRLAHINSFLPEYLANLKRSTHVRKVAATNGHGFIAIGKKPE
jgi:Lon protease-like protein